MTGSAAGSAAPETTCYRHGDRATGLRCTRCSRPACWECLRPAPVGSHCLDCLREANRLSPRQRRAVVSRTLTTLTPRSAVMAIVAVCCALFVVQTVSPATGVGLSRFTSDFASIGVEVADGEWWRLVTSVFLHHGLMHLGLNMVSLVALGPENEVREGTTRFALVFLLAGTAGSVAGYLLESPFTFSAGASGAIFGLLGLSLMHEWSVGADTRRTLGWIVMGMIYSVVMPGVSLWGHTGGLVAGVAYGLVRTRVPPRIRRPVELLALAIAAVLMAGVVAARTSQITAF